MEMVSAAPPTAAAAAERASASVASARRSMVKVRREIGRYTGDVGRCGEIWVACAQVDGEGAPSAGHLFEPHLVGLEG